MKAEDRQGWTRTILAVGTVGAYLASNFVGQPVEGLKEIALLVLAFYFAKNDN